MKEKFYVTTPIYYVNAKPHIGHAYTTVAADVLARFQRLQGREVFFLTGTDEHGLKIQKKAEEAGKEPQVFVDEIAEEFKGLWKKLNINYDNFIRTTSENHKKAVTKVLQTLFDKGAIYKGEYEGLYCVGCEQFKSENELVDGKCPDHETVPEKMKEECYLMKMTEIQDRLIAKIEKDELQISPSKYKNEMLSFLKSQPLRDVSISRKNVKWGIPLPFDQDQTAYVWVDALLNYLTGLGWDGEEKKIPEFWPADVQLMGKDILRVHATIWQAILIHLGIENPKMIFTHGHILSGGKKMSKTLGNVIGIDEMLEKFGTDGARYLLLSAGTFGDDVDVTMERLVEKYNSDLANGLGNLVSRIITLNKKTDINFKENDFAESSKVIFGAENEILQKNIENIGLDLELKSAMINVQVMNKYVEDNKPWEIIKTDSEKFKAVMEHLSLGLLYVANKLIPFMPDTAAKIKKSLETKQTEILFQRIR